MIKSFLDSVKISSDEHVFDCTLVTRPNLAATPNELFKRAQLNQLVIGDSPLSNDDENFDVYPDEENDLATVKYRETRLKREWQAAQERAQKAKEREKKIKELQDKQDKQELERLRSQKIVKENDKKDET